MPSRRRDGEPRLVDRVRWGNLARLGAVVAAGLLVALGPRACGADGDGGGTALPPDQPVAAAPEPPAPVARRDETQPTLHRPKRTHKGTGRRRAHASKPQRKRAPRRRKPKRTAPRATIGSPQPPARPPSPTPGPAPAPQPRTAP